MAADTPSSDTIFCVAIEIASDSERAAYIAQACGEKLELRARVEKLVDAHFRAGSFLESPPDKGETVDSQPPAAEKDLVGQWHAEPPRLTPVAERPGAIIGPYKLVQEIGEGGMGTVFLAQQTEPVKRLVALKVIKPGMDSRQVITRFEAERQALALMDHPNIAKVLDAGATDSGRPYFVMELVKGVPITRYCDEHRLTPRQRLELMVPVCQAVQHAHQKGIIHRDLKPSNVLVASYDGKPVPKVIDFGVAKATGQQLTEHTLVTGFGTVVGTLEYMSPEQAEFNQLDIDTRSDVYSLGVLLYELLTGTTPLEKKRLKETAMLEVLRLIREEEPPRPSTRLSTVEGLPSIAACRGLEPKKLSGVVRGELDWIVMKALEKDRNRRYETANGLATDVRRYLADEPVVACPPSAVYRLRKFVRRNKRLLTSVGAITASLVVGLAVTVVLLVTHAIEMQTHAIEMQEEQKRTTKEYDRAETALKQAEGNLYRADRNLSLALEALDKVYMRRYPKEQNRILRDERMAEAERKSLQRGLQFYERFAQENAGHEKLQRATAQAYLRAGGLRQDLEDWAEAQDNYAKAIAIFEKWADESHGSLKDQFDLARCYYGMTLNLQKTGQHGEAARMCRRAIALWEKLDADHKVSFDPSQVGYRIYRVELGYCLQRMAEILSSAQQRDKAEETLRQALRLFEGLLAEDPTEPFSRPKAGSRPREDDDTLQKAVPPQAKYADCVGHTARMIAQRLPGNRMQEKLPLFQKAAEVFGKLTAAHPESTYFLHFAADTHRSIGDVLSTLKRDEEAEKAYRKAVDLFQKMPGGKFGPPDGYRNIHEEAWGYMALANFLMARNRSEGATTVLRQAIALYEKFPNDPDSPLILGRLHSRLGQWDKVIADYSKAIEWNPKNSELWTQRGFAYLSLRQWDKSIQDYTKAIELAPEVHANWWHRGRAYLELGQWDKVVANYSKALEKYPNDSNALYFRAVGYMKLNQLERAVADLRQAVAKGYHNPQGIQKDDRFASLRTREDFQKLLAEVQAKALEPMRRAIAQNEKEAAAHPNEPGPRERLARGHYNLGNVLYHKGQVEEAIAEYREAIRIQKDYPEAHSNLGNALRDKGRLDEAIDEYPEAIRTKKKFPEAYKAYYNFGLALANKGRLDEAIAEYREALQIKKDYAEAHYSLGNALRDKGRLDEAIDEFRAAIRIKSDYAEAYCNLGSQLEQKGKFTEALVYRRRGHELGSKNPRWRYPSAQWLRNCERLVKLDDKLPAILSGQKQPIDSAERLGLAQLCQMPCKNRYAAAVRFFRDAFDEEPKLADDLNAQHRYNAACAAALAGCAQGQDADRLDTQERAHLRQQGLDWLRADLEAWRQQLGKEAEKSRSAATVAKKMRHWLADRDFAGVRGVEALAKLPEGERQAWQKLWDDVAVMLGRATGKITAEKKSAPK